MLKPAIFSFALAALLATAAQAGPAEDQYAVAAGHYKEKRWKFAAEEFQAFLAKFPEHAKAVHAQYYLGETLLQLRQFDKAAETFAAFAQRWPRDAHATRARFRLGEALYFAAKFDQAKTALEMFVRAAPSDPLSGYALAYLGDMALRGGDAQQAQNWYGTALQRFPQGPLQDDCRFGLARALEALGQGEEARRLFLALAAKPQSAWAAKAQFRLGLSFYATGEYEQALDAFQEMIAEPRFAASPLRRQAALAAGESLYQLKQYDAAQRQFEALLDQKPVAAEARYWLGLTKAAQQDWPAATAALLAAADQAKDDAKIAAAARYHAGDALLHAGRAADARTQFEMVVKTWPQHEFAEKSWLGLMQAALAAGDHQQVESLAKQFAAKYPTAALARHVDRLVGRSLLERKDYARAAAAFEKLLAVYGDKTDRQADHDRCLLAAAYIGQEHYDDALKAVANIPLAKEPPSEERQLWIDVVRQRAAALVGVERFSEAAQLLELLLAAMPDAKTGSWAKAELMVALAKGGQLDRAKKLYQETAAQPLEGELAATATFALANTALDEGDADWAGELFAKLASQAPTFRARGLWGLARSRMKQDDLTAAVAALDQLLTTEPRDELAPEAALARGQLAEQLKDDQGALRSYQQVIDHFASSPRLGPALLAAARLEQRLKRPAKAAALYDRLDKQFPQFPEHESALYEWAWALREAGEGDKADAVFGRLREQTPHGRFWSDAVYRLAERAYEGKDFSRAEKLVAELLAGGPAAQVAPHALYLQAQIAAAQSQWPRVPGPLERLIADYPDNPIVPLAQYLVAEAAYRQDDFDRAAELFRELAENMRGRTDSWAPMVPLRRAQLLAQRKEWHDALEVAAEIEADFPDFEQLYEVDYVIGRCQANLGRLDDARAAYGRVIKSPTGEKTETAAKAQWMIGEAYFHQKNYEAALREYLRVEILYDYPTWQAAALFEAAKCHEQLGEAKQAAELYEKLIKSYPNSPLVKDAAERLPASKARASK
ncbi:MAG TPA: tetratricopeptide repeat protein [Pirellulales bacterium]